MFKRLLGPIAEADYVRQIRLYAQVIRNAN